MFGWVTRSPCITGNSENTCDKYKSLTRQELSNTYKNNSINEIISSVVIDKIKKKSNGEGILRGVVECPVCHSNINFVSRTLSIGLITSGTCEGCNISWEQ